MSKRVEMCCAQCGGNLVFVDGGKFLEWSIAGQCWCVPYAGPRGLCCDCQEEVWLVERPLEEA